MSIKATGIVHKVDELGRVVLPKELRTVLDINEGDGLEIFTQDDKIILRKYQPGCHICGSVGKLLQVHNLILCQDHVDLISTYATQAPEEARADAKPPATKKA